jgi:hypothetical protein
MDRSRDSHRGRRPLRRAIGAALVATTFAATIVGLAGAPAAAADYPTIDGLFSETGPVAGGSSFVLKVTGRGGVPETGVGAVALNVTVTNPTTSSYLTAFPTGATRPTAANLVFTAGQTVPNMVIVKVGDGGQVSLFNYSGATDLIVDVLGWFPTGASFTGVTPARLLDSRPGYPTIDNQFAGTGPVGSGATFKLTVAGRGTLPASGVGAVALNVTVTNPSAPSFLTVWPTGAAQPTAANLNYVAGQSVPNMVMAKVGDGGQISLFNYSGTADLVVDVLGWFPQSGSFTGITPARLMDTRAGYVTIDGQAQGIGPIGAGAVSNLVVVGRGNVPATGVGAVALNVSITNPTAPSFLTVYPTGAARPTAANLNYVPGQTVPNMVIVKVGDGGQISLFNYAGSADVIVDVLGWFPAGASFTGLTPARLMDSRLPPPVPPAAIGSVRNLLVVRPSLHQMAGTDRIAVWVCDVPATTTNPQYAQVGPTRLAVDPQQVADWARQNVSTWFTHSSKNRYRVEFTALGRIALSNTDDPNDCLDKAVDMTGSPYTNVFVTDTSTRGDGFGSPGLIYQSDALNVDRLVESPSVTGRGLWIGGSSIAVSSTTFPAPDILVHEIGHTLHWPHSFIGPYEYDNDVDVMSGRDTYRCKRSTGTGTYSWPCNPQQTLAFNRFAAGWIDDSQVYVHAGGNATVVLDAPATTGMQMIAAVSAPQTSVMLTLEARPLVGEDQYLAVEGVVAMIVDQRATACDFSFGRPCTSTERRHRQAVVNAADEFAHVLKVGTTTTIDGVTVTVSAKTGSTFTVQVSGVFSPPA